MKKILLLFVLFLSVGSISFVAYDFNEIPTTIVFEFQDGEIAVIDDGSPCVQFWGETIGGGGEYYNSDC